YVGNHSSGKMGYAIAEAARDRGAKVTLIAAANALTEPYGVRFVDAATASTMRDAVLSACQHADVLIMAAAVADFRPSQSANQKIKKDRTSGLSLHLEPTDDIRASVSSSGLDISRVGLSAVSEE